MSAPSRRGRRQTSADGVAVVPTIVPNRILFHRQQLEELRRLGAACYPGEACGFLVGRNEGNAVAVTALAPATNRAERRDRFLIDASDVYAVMRRVKRDGQEVVGVYHSHPDGAAVPSATDEGDAFEQWVHVIVAVGGGAPADIAAWFWDGAGFRAVGVETR